MNSGGEPVVLVVGEGDDGEAELAEEEGVLEDAGVADFGEGLFALEALAGFEADDGCRHFEGGTGGASLTETTLAVPTAALPSLEW